MGFIFVKHHNALANLAHRSIIKVTSQQFQRNDVDTSAQTGHPARHCYCFFHCPVI